MPYKMYTLYVELLNSIYIDIVEDWNCNTWYASSYASKQRNISGVGIRNLVAATGIEEGEHRYCKTGILCSNSFLIHLKHVYMK